MEVSGARALGSSRVAPPKAALLTPPGAGQAPTSRVVPCHLLTSRAHPGQRTAPGKEHDSRLGFGPGDSVAGIPLPFIRAGERPVRFCLSGPRRAPIRLAGSRRRIRAKSPGPQETGSVTGFRQDTLDVAGNDVRGSVRRQSESGPRCNYSVDRIPTFSQSPHKLSTCGNNRKT